MVIKKGYRILPGYNLLSLPRFRYCVAPTLSGLGLGLRFRVQGAWSRIWAFFCNGSIVCTTKDILVSAGKTPPSIFHSGTLWGSEFRAQGVGFRIQGSGFGAEGLGSETDQQDKITGITKHAGAIGTNHHGTGENPESEQ